MTAESLRHDGNQHVKDDNLADEDRAYEHKEHEHILSVHELLISSSEVFVASLEVGSSKVAHHEEYLVAECVPEVRGTLLLVIVVVQDATLLDSRDLEHVEAGHEHNHQLQEHKYEIPNVHNRFIDQVHILGHTVKQTEPEEHLHPDAKQSDRGHLAQHCEAHRVSSVQEEAD